MRKILIIAAVYLLVGCGPARRIPLEAQKDSVRIEIRDSVTFRDSIVLVPVPVESSNVILPADDSSHIETSLAVSDAYIQEGKLHHSLRNKHEALLPIELKLPEKIHQEKEYLIRDKVITETVTVEKQLSAWESFLMTLGKLTLAGLSIWLAVVVIKRFIVNK